MPVWEMTVGAGRPDTYQQGRAWQTLPCRKIHSFLAYWREEQHFILGTSFNIKQRSAASEIAQILVHSPYDRTDVLLNLTNV